jgi:hypothetical protein
MREFHGVLVTGVVALAAGCLAFRAGMAHGVGVAEGGAASDGDRRLGHGPMHGYGHWTGRAGSRADRRHQWIAEAHHRLHEEDTAASTAAAVEGVAGTDESLTA